MSALLKPLVRVVFPPPPRDPAELKAKKDWAAAKVRFGLLLQLSLAVATCAGPLSPAEHAFAASSAAGKKISKLCCRSERSVEPSVRVPPSSYATDCPP